jgi:MFS family permease
VVHVFGAALVAMLFVGFGAIGMAATANATVQLGVPDELRGRVISVYTTVFVGSTPLGGLLTGWIASAFSVEAAIAIGGVGSLLAGTFGLVWLRRIQARRGLSLTAAQGTKGRERVEPGAASVPTGARPR